MVIWVVCTVRLVVRIRLVLEQAGRVAAVSNKMVRKWSVTCIFELDTGL
ncbi:MAG: hypothetical protein RLY31_1799, partial [Bacteroidota bacterium]